MRAFNLLATGATLLASTVLADLDPIVVKGSKFFYKTNGTEFFIQGVAYQQDMSSSASTGTVSTNTTYRDPLANADRCKIDIPLLKQLNTNTIRVYSLDPTQDHSACMQLLVDNGIYIVADLSQPALSINRDTPAWNTELFARYTSVIDMFSKYTNVIGFFAGNEVSNQLNNTAASAFVKAAVRDSKAYIKTKGYRQMYVGYATNDDESIRENMANYFNCGNQDEAIDFWGYNIYSWCGNSSYTKSGYDQRVAEFSKYSVPSFFAEYGCNTPSPRVFTEVQALFSSPMTGTFSGGIVYMYFEEANNFGLVSLGSGTTPSKLPDFTNLASQMASVTPTGVSSNAYSPTNSPQACPSAVKGVWEAKNSPLPPAPNSQLCSCMYSSLSCVVKTGVSQENYGQLFGQVCGYGTACAGIKADPLSGTYGAYSMCNSTEQLGFAFDQYYKSQSSRADACNFAGSAVIKSASTASSCSNLLSQAGAAGTGTVSGGVGGSTSGTKKSAAGAAVIPAISFGSIAMGLYVTVATAVGFSLILL